ncbi:MAG: GntR family transcriptional regulator [Pseudomonadota bacterium]
MAEGENFVGGMVVQRRRETLAETVCHEIQDLIVSGEIAAGDKLNELSLAGRLDVSRGTVREAVRSLAQSGLIELVSNRGAFVRRISDDEVRDLYDLRGAIFALACARVARQQAAAPDPDLVASLNDNLAAMRTAHAEDDKAAYYRLNIAFHALLMRAAGNSRARAIYDGLVKEMHLFRRRGLSFATNIARSIDEHTAIVDAVSAGDEEAARAAGQRHIECGQARFMATRKDEQGS